MSTNEILQFSETDTGLNLLTQAEYGADAQRLIGHQPGVARSKLTNKAMRQSSLLAAAVAQFIADRQATNVTDLLTPAALATMLQTAMKNALIPTVAAGGTADAITATFVPALASLTDGQLVLVQHGTANLTTTPTLNANGLGAKTIVKGNNLPLAAGDIPGADYWATYVYDASLTKWVMSNPATGVILRNTAGIINYFPSTSAPSGYVKANGALLSRSAYAALWAFAQASGNLAASDGAWVSGQFSPGDGATTFRIPDLRGYHMRSFDDGRGVDGGRAIGTVQADQNLAHAHGLNDPGHTHGTTDPGHGHGVTDPQHAHSVYDPSHYHAIGDPGHVHSITESSSTGGGITPLAAQNLSSTSVNTNSSLTGITIVANTTGIGLWPSGTGVSVNGAAAGTSVNAAATGMSVASAGGAEARVKNLAMLACISY
jgi:microcystin-dependent protein